MIVPMKKLWLICQKSDRDAALDSLADLGVVHITPVVPPAGEAIDAAREEAAAIEHALRILPQEISAEMPGVDHSLSAPAVMHRIESYLVDRQKTEHCIANLRALSVDWLRDDDNLMRLCFLIGAIHLTLAHAWVAVLSWNRLTALAELGWIAVTWTIYFGVGHLVLSRPLPTFAGWLFLVGICLIVLFMTPRRALKRDFHKHIMLPLTLVGNFGDLISYVRLFAVGSATAAIAMAFNEMALGSGIRGPGQAVVASLILLVAHGLNILLCALAVLVHGVRLNTLEFCGQMGIQWNGFPYKPFAKERTKQ
jgi:vacuolar-type H+-ATPase subunit I/STV1